MPTAIETAFQGYRFRSRLEARWAVYFDAIGIFWRYEREGFDLGDGVRYLPDFWLPQVQMWAEVKPAEFTEAELLKVARLTKQTDFPCLLLVDVPACRSYDIVRWCSEIEMHEASDCVISMFKDYPNQEARFYEKVEDLTAEDFDPKDFGRFSDVPYGVVAARSARFEFNGGGPADTETIRSILERGLDGLIDYSRKKVRWPA